MKRIRFLSLFILLLVLTAAMLAGCHDGQTAQSDPQTTASETTGIPDQTTTASDPQTQPGDTTASSDSDTQSGETEQNGDPNCRHSIATVVVPPSCFADGYTAQRCIVCGYEVIEARTPAIGHHTEVEDVAVAPTCTEDGRTAGSHCSVCNEVFTACEVIPAKGHTESNWIIEQNATETADGSRYTKCTVCGETVKRETLYATGTNGLEFILLSDGTYAAAVGQAREAVTISVPAYHDGRKVTKIDTYGFQACRNLRTVVLPDTVQIIGERAFSNCSVLTTINIPASVSTIGSYAFSNCVRLAMTSAPNTVKNVGQGAFNNCSTVSPDGTPIPNFYHSEAWHFSTNTDNGDHVLLATTHKTSSFFSADSQLGDNPLNRFTVGWASAPTAMTSVNDELLLTRFENCLYDYSYHIIYLDFPNELNDTRENYLAGLKKMIDLCKKIQPQTPVVYVNTAVTEESDVRRLFESNGCQYWNYYRGKRSAFLEAHQLLAEQTPYRMRTNLGANEIPSGQMANYKEGITFDITEINYPTLTATGLPRVLIVGDSICYGYRDAVRERLRGVAYVDSYVVSYAIADPATLRGIAYLLQHYDYDVVHFNIALHNCAYDTQPGGYAKYLESTLKALQALSPDTKLIFATGTTSSSQNAYGQWVFNENTYGIWKERRDAAVSVCQKLGVLVDDLYTLCLEQNPAKADDLHFADQTALSAQVAQYLRSWLKAR